MNGINSLIKTRVDRECSLLSIVRRSTEETTTCPHQITGLSASTLILVFPTSKIVNNKHLLL
jgi:hypothetical protein